MEQTNHHNTEAVTILLKRIGEGEDPRQLFGEAGRLIKDVNSADIAAAEQTLIEAGLPARTVRQLSAAFVFIGMHAGNKRPEDCLPAGHILRKVTAEHDVLRCMVADLQEVSADIQQLIEMSDTSSEFRRLAHIAAHLDRAREHIEREEYVIFPYIRQYGWAGLCRAAQCDHIVIANEIDNLTRLTALINDVPLERFKIWLAAVTERLSAKMLEHLCYEDEILSPIAVAVIDDPAVWVRIRALCDEIGYCGIHH
jgi:DUF438 domain-containing protein